MKIESNKKSEIAHKVHREIEREREGDKATQRRTAQRILNATAIVAYLLGHAIALQRRPAPRSDKAQPISLWKIWKASPKYENLAIFLFVFFCGQFLFLQNSTMMKCRRMTSWNGHGQTGKQLGFQIYSWKCPAKLHIVAISYCQLAESSLLINCL